MKLRLQEASEKEIQNVILSWLNYQPMVIALQINTTGVFDPRTKKYRRPGRFVLAGTPDILISYTVLGVPVFIGMEVKSRRGIQSPDQKAFQARIEALGSYYFMVRSLEDAKTVMLHVKLQTMDRVLKKVSDLQKPEFKISLQS